VAHVLCFDFDDTIVLDNTARRIFERFAAPAWREDEEAYRSGRLSVEQYNAAAIDRIDPSVTREEIERFVLETATVRNGFVELVDWAAWHGWLPVVVSNGFDLYVDAVLDSLGLDRVARHAGRTTRGYRWRVRYLSPRGIELAAGFKLSYAQAFRAAGDFVVYFGDGESDVSAARLAAAVFARSTLWERLKDEHRRIYAFETFDGARAVLEREAEGWLRSFSSTTAAEG
jgi:2-hydroxy-3-keto-5-methylthiopentenyl-1-phosphate phosphatase